MADREERSFRTVADLARAVIAVARHFGTDQVVVIGSQAILLANPHSPEDLRRSPEIDLYPANAREWEQAQGTDLAEASEEINAWFGEGSQFHRSFGFYIDGVDESTATLPPGWRERANRRQFTDRDQIITVIAPRTEDLIVSKLCALRAKDRDFIRLINQDDEIDLELIRMRLDETETHPEKKRLAHIFLDTIALERAAACSAASATDLADRES